MLGLAVTARALRRETARSIRRFSACESGATAIEYGLIAALIAVVIIAALTVLGQQVSGGFSTIASAVQAAS